MKQFILPFVLNFMSDGIRHAQIEIDGDMLDWATCRGQMSVMPQNHLVIWWPERIMT